MDKRYIATALSVIIIISLIWFMNKGIPKNTMRPNVYEKGEPVKFRLDDTVQICTNRDPLAIKETNGSYLKLKHSCMGYVGTGVDQYCENGKIVSERVTDFVAYDFSGKDDLYGGCSDIIGCWNKTVHGTVTWNQKEYVKVTEKCEGKKIQREVKKQVPEGEYQIIVNGEVVKEFLIK